jgi:hypothetical protein
MLKGWLGEKETQFGMWMKLDGDTYKRFHNLIIATGNWTTQIDHVVLSSFGIFVIETKNYNGRIFGSENGKVWTQVLHGSKHAFQNPLHQNYRHTKALAEHLVVDHRKIHSIVFFIGDAELKTKLPPNVVTSGLSSYIKQFSSVVFSGRELAEIEYRLSRLDDATMPTRQHVANLKERYSSTTTCPKCGRPLVTKTARQGPRAGSEFLGCSGYPKCRYTREKGRN